MPSPAADITLQEPPKEVKVSPQDVVALKEAMGIHRRSPSVAGSLLAIPN